MKIVKPADFDIALRQVFAEHVTEILDLWHSLRAPYTRFIKNTVLPFWIESIGVRRAAGSEQGGSIPPAAMK
jgi:hypothetical protein